MERRISFIGAGRLGAGLALALTGRGYNVVAIASRRYASAQGLSEKIPGCQAVLSPQELADGADLIFITTPDSAISSVAAAVKWRPGQQLVHCCGAYGREILRPAADQGADTGAFHPLQTFAGATNPAAAADRLRGATFAISAQGSLQEFLYRAAQDLGGAPVSISDAHRPLYHAAAVLSCGYLATLLQEATALWQSFGFSEAEALKALLPLSRATLDNVAQKGLDASITGPATRGDLDTIRSHLTAIDQTLPELTNLYRALSEASLLGPLAKKPEAVALKDLGPLPPQYRQPDSPAPDVASADKASPQDDFNSAHSI